MCTYLIYTELKLTLKKILSKLTQNSKVYGVYENIGHDGAGRRVGGGGLGVTQVSWLIHLFFFNFANFANAN